MNPIDPLAHVTWPRIFDAQNENRNTTTNQYPVAKPCQTPKSLDSLHSSIFKDYEWALTSLYKEKLTNYFRKVC